MRQEHIGTGQRLHSFRFVQQHLRFESWRIQHSEATLAAAYPISSSFVFLSLPPIYFPIFPQRELASKKDQSLLRCHPKFRPKVYRCIGSGFFGVPQLSL
jgi:hypothetical protein